MYLTIPILDDGYTIEHFNFLKPVDIQESHPFKIEDSNIYQIKTAIKMNKLVILEFNIENEMYKAIVVPKETTEVKNSNHSLGIKLSIEVKYLLKDTNGWYHLDDELGKYKYFQSLGIISTENNTSTLLANVFKRKNILNHIKELEVKNGLPNNLYAILEANQIYVKK